MQRVIMSHSAVYGQGENTQLRAALCIEYGAECQLCGENWSNDDFCKMQIDHIIPRSMGLSAVSVIMAGQWNLPRPWTDNFAEFLLPPHIDSVFNLTIACPFHNLEKRDKLLHPAALHLLLQAAQVRSHRVLNTFSHLVGWDYHQELFPARRVVEATDCDDEGDELVR